MTLSHVRIVGSGLIGTSIGLGLALKGVGVSMKDLDARAQGLAEDLIKNPSDFPVDLVIFATPIGALNAVINGEFEANPKAAFIDISSVKSKIKSALKDYENNYKRTAGNKATTGSISFYPSPGESQLIKSELAKLDADPSYSPNFFGSSVTVSDLFKMF